MTQESSNLFHEIPDALVVLVSNGIYHQAKLYRRGAGVYAAKGAGFVRLTAGGGTTAPKVGWQKGDTAFAPRGLAMNYGERGAPKWNG